MKLLWLFCLPCIPGILSAQHVLRSELNMFRAGDEIIKQQVEYKNPGRKGAHSSII
jgi:hypothetical protein